LTGAATRVDGSLSLRFSTPELKPDEKTAFFEIQNANLNMLLQPQDNMPLELKDIKGEFDTKTPSQRLRASIFVWWSQQGKPGDFEDFYRRRMETIIEQVKAELQPV
jgi:hypothetical protein